MHMSWLLLAIVAWALGAVFVIALCRMAGDQDRAARHAEKAFIPHSDVTVTQYGG
jgi:hypothetical protein